MEHFEQDYIQIKSKQLASGNRVLDFSMINPKEQPPQVLMDKLVESVLKPNNHRYAVSRGIGKLRAAFAEKYQQKFNVKLNFDQEICITFGSKDAILHTLMSECEENDFVLLPKPFYPAHLSAVKVLRLKVGFFNLASNQNEIVNNIVTACSNTKYKVLILNFPNNPTGFTIDQRFYSSLIEQLKNKVEIIINDFVYGEMPYSETATLPSLLSINVKHPKLVEVYSLSKAYSIPGWRVAALSGNQEVVSKLAKLKQYTDYGIFLPIQHSVAEIINDSEDYVKEVSSIYAERFRCLKKLLELLNWKVFPAGAGCSLWAKIPENLESLGANQLTKQFLSQIGVAILPGSVFGDDTNKFVRFALVEPEENYQELKDRLKNFKAIV